MSRSTAPACRWWQPRPTAGTARARTARPAPARSNCAVAFTQTTVDENGRPVRDPHSSSYLATFAPAAEFGMLMAAEARRRGAGHVRQLTILGDGAAWIWNLATRHFPEATQIVDLFHAREHLHDLGRLLAFMLGDRKHAGSPHGTPSSTTATSRRCWPPPAPSRSPAQSRRAGHRPGLLRDQRPPDALPALPLPRPVHRLRRRGGRVQGGHRPAPQTLRHALVLPGATGILTLRCQQASGRWEEIWQQPPPVSAA